MSSKLASAKRRMERYLSMGNEALYKIAKEEYETLKAPRTYTARELAEQLLKLHQAALSGSVSDKRNVFFEGVALALAETVLK